MVKAVLHDIQRIKKQSVKGRARIFKELDSSIAEIEAFLDSTAEDLEVNLM